VSVQQIGEELAECLAFETQRNVQFVEDALLREARGFRWMATLTLRPRKAERSSSVFGLFFLFNLSLMSDSTLASHSHYDLPELQDVRVEEHLDRHRINDVRCEHTALQRDQLGEEGGEERREDLSIGWRRQQDRLLDSRLRSAPEGGFFFDTRDHLTTS
jgi:hypothetical protein